MNAILILQIASALYQALRDQRYVRIIVAGLHCLILGLIQPRPLWESKWAYTPSMGWETDFKKANKDFQLPEPDWVQGCNHGLKSYTHGKDTYYVDKKYEERLRFYLALKESKQGVILVDSRRLLPGLYIGRHKLGVRDYYDECMSGCSFRAVKCRLVIDPESPMPNYSRLLSLVSIISLMLRTQGSVALSILVAVTTLDVSRSLFQTIYLKVSEKLKWWFRSLLSFLKFPIAEYILVLIESMNESMRNCSQYTYSYARLTSGFALLGNGSRVSCEHEVLDDHEDSGSEVINFEKVRIKVYRQGEKIGFQCNPFPEIDMQGMDVPEIDMQGMDVPEIDMQGMDDYEENDWGFVKRRISFAAKHKLFPLWSLDERKAHCKEIKYDFFNRRYHKGCVIKIQGTRVVGGDFELDTSES